MLMQKSKVFSWVKIASLTPYKISRQRTSLAADFMLFFFPYPPTMR